MEPSLTHRLLFQAASKLLFVRSGLLIAFLFAAWMPQGQAQLGAGSQASMGTVQRGLPKYLKEAGISQNLNHQLPLSAQFVDSSGKAVSLGKYFHHRPVVMAQVYFNCGMLCPQVMHGAAEALKKTGFTTGKDYDVVIVSFDPQDTPQQAAKEKQLFLSWLGDPGAASDVHFLTGAQPSIDALTNATGFHYVRVPGPDGKMDQFAHSSVIMVATPDGRLSKYFSGISYVPRDLRLALVTASNHKIGTAADLFLLYCCSYDPIAGKYTVSILRLLGIAGCVTILIILGLLYVMSRKPKTGTLPPPTAV